MGLQAAVHPGHMPWALTKKKKKKKKLATSFDLKKSSSGHTES
jgi:hypothetical protein